MSRAAIYAVYTALVLIWSSTWVAIKIGLEDCPPLLGAGVRFALAGVVLLGISVVRGSSLRTDVRLAALLGLLPFAFSYGLVYWGEQHIPSGLAAVLFGILPLYAALLAGVLLPEEPLRLRLVAGVLVALAGLALAFAESLELGNDDLAWAGALALVAAPLGPAIGNVGQKLRGSKLDALVLNGWAMLGGGLLLLAFSGGAEDWGDAAWSAKALGSIAYLAIVGSAVAFVSLTVLLRHLTAQSMSFLAMLLPFGALLFGAAVYSEALTARAAGGALLVAAGLMVAQGTGPVRLAARRNARAAGPG